MHVLSLLKTWFNNLSLYKKILLIISATTFFTFFVFFFSIHFLTKRYEKELYQTNAKALNHVCATITGEMEMIESISISIISDGVIQENLYNIYEQPDSNRRSVYKRNVYQALLPYTFNNDYIQSINIVLDDGSNICMGNSDYITQFSLDHLKEIALQSQGRINWVPTSQPGKDVCCVRLIRQQKFMRLNKLADLYIVVDMEHLISDALQNAGYLPLDSNFILMAEGIRFYPATPYHDELYPELLKEMETSGDSYIIVPIDGKKEFVITGSLPYAGWNYLYFRDYNPIFRNILSARFQVLACSIISCIAALFITWLVLGRILRHIDFLIEKIRCFGNGEPPPTQIQNYDYKKRLDEIGQLHRDFDAMTQSVKVLRDENYDKQLLLRDATIRMLQQQINPHFLYNALDTINWMAQKSGADDISVMARSLGNLFRVSITGQEDLVPLAEELSFLNNYIQIQTIRFKDRLNFELIVPKDISTIQVPKLCIQPLVENALKHAMEYSDQLCTIRVTVLEQESVYEIKVTNTGSLFEDDLIRKIEEKKITPQGSGVGLNNINSRLKLLYGDDYGLICYNQDGCAVVMMTIPKERRTEYVKINDCR